MLSALRNDGVKCLLLLNIYHRYLLLQSCFVTLSQKKIKRCMLNVKYVKYMLKYEAKKNHVLCEIWKNCSDSAE